MAHADPRLLDAAHRRGQREVVDRRVVDADRADLQTASDALTLLAVAREHRGSEAVAGVVDA